MLKLNFIQGQYKNQEYFYNADNKQTIVIGRSKNADIIFKDNSISRIQCV
jgi:pSer/pThr/pTyr-binding forkhead associated (FHA) protein